MFLLSVFIIFIIFSILIFTIIRYIDFANKVVSCVKFGIGIDRVENSRVGCDRVESNRIKYFKRYNWEVIDNGLYDILDGSLQDFSTIVFNKFVILQVMNVFDELIEDKFSSDLKYIVNYCFDLC